MDEQALLAVAQEAAEAAGEVLLARFGGRRAALRTKSTKTDVVGEADLAAERAIREVVAARCPDDAWLAEEGGSAPGTSGRRWVVDPLDGTVNYLFGIPQWAVSVAVQDDTGALAGIVLDPSRDERWTATRSGAAHLDGAPLESRAEAAPALAESLVATGFGYDAEVRRAQARAFERLLGEVRDVRRLGAAALDLVWTAAGRYDAYFERGVQPWDVAAGGLLCERVGLDVIELDAVAPQPGGVLVAPPSLTAGLRALVP